MQSYRFSDPVQKKTYQRLDALVGKGAAAFYKDACYLMELDPPLESTAHLVGHLLREIESSLRDVLEPLSVPHISDPNQTSIKCPECKHKFNYAKPNPSHKDEIHAILKALEINPEEDIAKSWLKLAGNNKKYGLHSLAHRQDLAAPRVIDNEYKDFWRKIQRILDTLLDKFEARAVEIRETLDKLILKTEGTKQDIDFLRLNIPNSAFALGYFFDQLESSDWLELLNKAGFFDTPPGIEVDAETKGFRFPIWAQSRYLIKVAPNKPEIVRDIAIKLLESGCKNIRIYEDLAEAALKMPSTFAACWVEKAIMWLRKQSDIGDHLPDILGKLITHLGHGDQVDKAIKLAQEILIISPQKNNYLYDRVIILFDKYSYEKIIEEHILPLAEYQPNEVLNLFCELLDRYLSLSYPESMGELSEDDLFSWGPTLECTAISPHEVAIFLVKAIWRITKQIVEQDSNKLRYLLEKFKNYHRRIFDRLSLYLLRFYPEQVSDLITERLTDQNRLEWLGLYLERNETYYSCEHAFLLREQFANLPANEKENIFCWLRNGPKDMTGIQVEEQEKHVKFWQRDWFSIIHEHLPLDLISLYNQLVQELGSPNSLDSVFDNANRDSTAWWGPHSSKSGIDLSEISKGGMHQLFDFLQDYESSKEFHKGSIHGLAWDLAEQVIAPNPQQVVSHIERFKELDLQFILCLLRGLSEALKNHSSEQKRFSWEPVLEFCAWVLENFREICDRSTSDNYSEWGQICDAVLELVDAGFLSKGANNISLTLRHQIWQLLEPLTSDPHVTPGFTLHYQSSSMGSYRDSKTTVRGKAMHAVVRYAIWIRQDANGNAKVSQNFEDMPEVQKVLEYHLNPQQDPSSAIRAVYGQWFPQLLQLASEWSLKRIDQIFPEELDSQWLFEAAWSGYAINRNRVNTSVFSNLRRKYIHAVGQLPNLNSSSREQSETAIALSGHLLHLFWHEVIDLDEPDRLLEDFFTKAPIHIRGKFLETIGSWLRYQNVEISDKLRQRLQIFLNWRIDQAKHSNSTVEQFSDLKYFGWLFASDKFDAQWSISRLLDVLKLFGTVNDCRKVLKRLENLASVIPQEVVQCLSLIADGNEALKWFVSSPSGHHRSILQTALESNDQVAQQAVRELINRLVARNLGDYRDLLSMI